MSLLDWINRDNDSGTMPLGDHLDELRKRLMWGVGGLVPIIAVTLAFGEEILGFLTEPVRKALKEAGFRGDLIVTGPLEAFGQYMWVSLVAAILIGLPWVLYQLWLFVAPGLFDREKRFVYFLLPLSTILMVTSFVFLFRVILPIVLSFFVSFGSDIGVEVPLITEMPAGMVLPVIPILNGDPPAPEVGQMWVNQALREVRYCIEVKDGMPILLGHPLVKEVGIAQEYRVAEYVKLLTNLALAFAGGFQTPVVVLLLGWAGVIDGAFLKRFRRHAILLSGIVAAFLTPGDPTTLFLLWIPLYILYELGGVLLRIFPARAVSGGLRFGKKARAAAAAAKHSREAPTRETTEDEDDRP